jgi:ATP-binding cassette subfamily B protein RaxB
MRYYQAETTECGLICLAYISSKFGAHVDVSELRQKYTLSIGGLNLSQLSEIAGAMDMLARAVKCEIEELADLKVPAILHWGLNHFVVLERVRSKHIDIYDPTKGRVKVPLAMVDKRFTGIALELNQAPQFRRRREKAPLSIWAWIRLTPELYGGLGQILILSVILQAYVLISPFYLQLAIDQGALKGDVDLLTTLAVGFGLFGLFNVGATLLRNLATQYLSAAMGWDMSLRLFRHLVRLPLEWFQRRKLADTISRFDSINPIRDLVSGALISSLIDGALAITTLCMMFLFSWQLAVLVLVGVGVGIALRVALLPIALRLSGENLAAQIAENGKRIETIRASQTIKIMSAEVRQETQWSNRYSELTRKTVAKGNFTSWQSSFSQVLDVIVTTIVIYVAARMVIAHGMTVGIVYAFLSYKSQFSTAASNVASQVIQWRLCDVYSFRLADIVLNPKEAGIDQVDTTDIKINGEIEIRNLSFKYGVFEPYIFRDINLKIPAGEFVAIVGPSGAGKSTLLKAICGLYPAAEGEVRIDGRPLSFWGPALLRRNFGIVMQDDELLSGSIADNVAFFDEEIEMDRVWQALEAASLKEEIMALPMKAHTFVGDMGGTLSGGQKQRLLIARAIYKKPKIIFLDEATSHLDVKNEQIINGNLKAMNITLVVIAHRIETIRSADKVFDILNKSFVQLPADLGHRLNAKMAKGT